MKKAFLLFIGSFFLLSCNQQRSVDREIAKPELQSSIKVFFTVPDLDAEDFEIVERNDTTYYLKQLYEGLAGKDIQFDQSSVSVLTAKIRFDFGFLQYTTDDKPAITLEYTKKSKWSNLQAKEGTIEVPDFFGNSNNPKVYQALGFSNKEQLLEWVSRDDFEEIRKESVNEQTNFYKALLKDKSLYQVCCPEYIQQAEAFLNSQANDYKSTAELGLELIYNSLTIDIKGQLKNGKQFHRVIVEK